MVPQFTAFSEPATLAAAAANAAGAGSQEQNPTRRILGHCKNERQTCSQIRCINLSLGFRVGSRCFV